MRILVVVAFLTMAAVPAYLAYDAGIFPGPTHASADVVPREAVSRVTPLAWPEDALGLAATETTVLWEQRDPSSAVAGLWSYDTRTGRVDHVLGRSATGKAAGFPAAAGELVVWAAWAGRRGNGPARIEAYDTDTTRRWTAARTGREPAAAGESVMWVEPDGDGPGRDVIRGLDSLTDEEYAVEAGGRVRDLAAWGSWVAWISGRGKEAEVWAGSYRSGATRHRLADAGTAVAIDRDRVIWATRAGRHSTRIVSWDRGSRRTAVLCEVVGAVSSLTLDRRYAAWVTSEAPGTQIWVYDFDRGRADAIAQGRRQASPVIAAGGVYWADDRTGQWVLYRRSLSQ